MEAVSLHLKIPQVLKINAEKNTLKHHSEKIHHTSPFMSDQITLSLDRSFEIIGISVIGFANKR